MPDRYGFNHLGTDVRCIDCPEGGPVWSWPPERREHHAASHQPATTQPRPRSLLAPVANHNPEENKETTMATRKPNKPEKVESTKTVTIDVLRQAGEPLPAGEVAKRVIDSGRATNLKGKTPEATISAMLAVGSKPGGAFTRVAKGTYSLADTAPATEAKPEAPTRATRSDTPVGTGRKSRAKSASEPNT